jgi:hypothetical protein
MSSTEQNMLNQQKEKTLDFIREHHSRQETVPMLGQLVDKV